ncbi:hypothetical protein ACJX0J_017174, partial [Zea mays]
TALQIIGGGTKRKYESEDGYLSGIIFILIHGLKISPFLIRGCLFIILYILLFYYTYNLEKNRSGPYICLYDSKTVGSGHPFMGIWLNMSTARASSHIPEYIHLIIYTIITSKETAYKIQAIKILNPHQFISTKFFFLLVCYAL